MTARISTTGILIAAVGLAAALVLAVALNGGPAGAAFPGKNGGIAFDRYLRGSGPSERKAVYTIKSNGERLRKLTRGRYPNWSASGKKVVFARRKGGVQSIYTMKANGKKMRRLTRTRTLDGRPAWSPNGKKIVFTRAQLGQKGQPPGPNHIYVMKANGNGQKRLVKSRYNADQPDWSPNGRRIVFASLIGSNTTASLFTIRPNGKGKRKLTNAGDNPDWSPNGKQIAFERYLSGGRAKIFVMTAKGKRAHAIGPAGDLKGNNAAWSPDGKEIAFVGFNQERFIGIFKMNADGTNTVQLTVGGKAGDFAGNDSNPDWRPLKRK